jgi:hypothetical protein
VKKANTDEKLKPEDLHELAEERLADAEALYDAKRYEGAFYICGYAVEVALKKKICTTLGWSEYPTSGKLYVSFKTHDLEFLLHLSGVEKNFVLSAEWSIVMKWGVEIRYSSEKIKSEDVKLMIEAARSLVRKL